MYHILEQQTQESHVFFQSKTSGSVNLQAILRQLKLVLIFWKRRWDLHFENRSNSVCRRFTVFLVDVIKFMLLLFPIPTKAALVCPNPTYGNLGVRFHSMHVAAKAGRHLGCFKRASRCDNSIVWRWLKIPFPTVDGWNPGSTHQLREG